MAFDDIKKAILAEAKSEAENIEAEGRKKAAELKSVWDKRLEAKKIEIMNSVRQKANQKVQQSQFKLQAQSQTEIISQKQKLIDKVYKRALTKLTELSDDKYVDLLADLITKLPAGEGSLTSVKDKEGLLKKAIKKSGLKFELASETIAGQGGFVFHSKEVDIDYTFSTLINSAREETILAVTEKLFNHNQNQE